MRAIIAGLVIGLAGAIAGGFVAWQYLAWRVYVAEGIRDMYMVVAGEAQQMCNAPQPGKWPERRGP